MRWVESHVEGRQSILLKTRVPRAFFVGIQQNAKLLVMEGENQVKVEAYDGTYDCLICGTSVRGQPALHCTVGT